MLSYYLRENFDYYELNYFFSRTDGDPKYLNDLEHQVINRNRLRQVKHFSINFSNFKLMISF